MTKMKICFTLLFISVLMGGHPVLAIEVASSVPAPVEIHPEALPPMTAKNSDASAEALTLEACIDIALKQSTEVQKSENQEELAGVQLIQAYAQFLPNLSVQGNYSYLNGNSYFTLATPTFVSAKNIGVGYTVLSTLNLFNGLSDYSGLKSALLKKETSHLSLKRAREQIILDVTQSFLQVALDDEIVKIYKKTLALSQERELLLKEQTSVGVKNLADLFRQQARTSADELNYLSALNKERNDQISLLRKLRLDVSKNYIIVSPKIDESQGDTRYSDEISMVREGLTQRSDLKASNYLVDASVWDIQSSQASFYPRLDLGLTVLSAGRFLEKQSVQGNNQVPLQQENMWSQLGNQVYYTVGVTLTWNLFDRWTTRVASAQARIRSENLKLEALDKKLQVEGDIRQAHGDYQTALQRLVTTRKGLESATKAFEVTSGRYEVGSATFVDVLSAQTGLVEAESDRAQALIGFFLQGKTMDYALGLSDPNFKQIE